MTKLHIDGVYEKESSYPMIINFQNGYTTDNFKPIPCCLQKDIETGTKIIATELDNMLYVGKEEIDDIGITYLLARNKKTGKVRLIEVGSAELKAIGDDELLKNKCQKEATELELSRTFGSKKHKKTVEAKEKLRANLDVVTEQMKNISQTATESKADISEYITNHNDDFYLPPINREADKVQDVYDISKILSPNEYDKIYAELKDHDYASDYHIIVKNIVSNKDLSPRETVLAAYASGLYKLYLLTVKDLIKKGYVLVKHSPTLENIIMKNFTQTVKSKIYRPITYKDKTLCHALVFSLILNNYKINIDVVLTSLKVSPSVFISKTRAIGAWATTKGKDKTLVLKIPLCKPALKRKSAKF